MIIAINDRIRIRVNGNIQGWNSSCISASQNSTVIGHQLQTMAAAWGGRRLVVIADYIIEPDRLHDDGHGQDDDGHGQRGHGPPAHVRRLIQPPAHGYGQASHDGRQGV